RERSGQVAGAKQGLETRRQERPALSRTAALTGLVNRRYFEERLALEFARSNRYRAPLSCMMLDIDHFKKVNDSYGHPFGDKVLIEVARIAEKTLRDVDLLARYGGEELIGLLPETGPREALRVCERIREGVEKLRIGFVANDGAKKTVTCTAAVGVATCPGPA